MDGDDFFRARRNRGSETIKAGSFRAGPAAFGIPPAVLAQRRGSLSVTRYEEQLLANNRTSGGSPPAASPAIIAAGLFVFLFTGFFITFQSPAAEQTYQEPFYLGVAVDADPSKWGDLPKDGRFTIEGICGDLGSLGVNALWVSGFDGRRADRAQMGRWLECARNYDMKVAIQGSAMDYTMKKGVSVVEQETHLKLHAAPAWQEIAKRFKRHYSLLAYVPVEGITDSAEEGAGPTLQLLNQLAVMINELDPVHPVVALHDAKQPQVLELEAGIRKRSLKAQAAFIRPFAYSNDWDNESWKTEEAATNGLLELAQERVRTATTAGVPFWLVAQGFGSVLTQKWVGQWNHFRLPGKEEIAAQVWTAILAGAKGIIFESYQSSQEPADPEKARIEQWEVRTGLRALNGETTAAYTGLQDVLKALSRHLKIIGSFKPDGKIEALRPRVIARRFRAPQGKAYAVVLNQNLFTTVKLPPDTAIGLFTAQNGLRIAPGQGVLFQADDAGGWVPVTPCEVL